MATQVRRYLTSLMVIAIGWSNVGAMPASAVDFAPAVPWRAQFTENLQLFTSDDAVPDETRPYVPSWELSLVKFIPSMAGSITVATTLDTTDWFVSPAISPTTSDGIKTYRWVDQTSFAFNSYLSPLGRPGQGTSVSSPSSLGASISRESVGGTRIEPAATVNRAYVVRVVGTTDTTVDVSVFLTSGSFGTPNPVIVSNQRCDGARILGGLPGGFAWNLNLAQGVPVELNCSAILTNTAAAPAHYMPVVSATRLEQTSTAPERDRVQYSFGAPPLGDVTFDVTPPADWTTQGTLTRIVNRNVFLAPTNQALAPTQLTYTGATSSYLGEGATLSARLTHHSTFPVIGRTIRFDVDGSTYTATSGVDGTASVAIPAGLGQIGAHIVTTSFAEDAFFAGSTLTTTVTVLRHPTTLLYAGDVSATFGFAQLAARLIDERSGAPLAGKTLSFAIDDAMAVAATTDITGTAVLAGSSASILGPGEHIITVTFADDATYAASTATGHIAIANSVGKVSGDVVTTNGARVAFNVKSQGLVTGTLDLTRVMPTVSVRTWIGFGIAPDRKTAVIYGLTASGEDVLVELADAGEPGRNDRAIVRLNGASLTGDGTLVEGNVQIK